MNILDRARIVGATPSYDLWLDLAGVPGRRRRELGRELRANLGDAAALVGSRKAVRNLGSIREMAAAPESRVTGAMTFFPGSSLTYSPSASGFSVSIGFGWVCLLVGFIAFIIAAQPWRLLRRHTVSPTH